MSRFQRPGRGGVLRAAFVLVLAALAAFAVGAVHSGAATPSMQSVAVPGKAGQTATVTWTGTIPAVSAHPTSSCNGAGVQVDDEGLALTIPRKGYDRFDATFTFQISWTPSNPSGDEQLNDEVLTVNSPDNRTTAIRRQANSDRATAVRQPRRWSPTTSPPAPSTRSRAGTSTRRRRATRQTDDRDGCASRVGIAQVGGRARARVLRVGSGRPSARRSRADHRDRPRRPHLHLRPDGLLERSDYAQVSTDGGNQFHILGTQPRGQQSAGGGGDCALATGVAKNAYGAYQYAYAGLGALSGFTTSTSADNGHSIATAGADVNGGITSNGVLADRQWMTFIDDHTVLLSWNQQQPRNVVVQRSTDGGLTYSPITSMAAPNPEFPGPMRYIASSNTVFMPWTKGEQVNLAVSRDGGDDVGRVQDRVAATPSRAGRGLRNG